MRVRVDRLHGLIPAYRVSQLDVGSLRPSALYVEARLCSHGEVLGIPLRTEFSEAALDGCAWDTWLTFPIKASRRRCAAYACPPLCLRMWCAAWQTLSLSCICWVALVATCIRAVLPSIPSAPTPRCSTETWSM